MVPLNVLYFGDQSVQAHDSIKALYIKAKQSVVLAEFLRSSHQALATALLDSSGPEKAVFEGKDFLELCTLNRQTCARNAAVSTVLSCVAQLGWAFVCVSSSQAIAMHAHRAQPYGPRSLILDRPIVHESSRRMHRKHPCNRCLYSPVGDGFAPNCSRFCSPISTSGNGGITKKFSFREGSRQLGGDSYCRFSREGG